jgi:hypothetical protein
MEVAKKDRPPGAAAWIAAAIVGAAALSAAIAPAQASPVKMLGEQGLVAVMDSYLAHLARNDPKGLPMAPGANVRENTAVRPLGQGVWALTKAIKATQTFADPLTGNVRSINAIVLRSGELAQVSIRLKVVGGKITEVETVANTGGANKSGPYPGGPFNAENVLEQDVGLTAIVPPNRRSSREELIKIADEYFEAMGTHDPKAARFGSRCERYESGSRGTNYMRRPAGQPDSPGTWSGDCGTSLLALTGGQAYERRFPIVDVKRGIVVSYGFLNHRERNPPQDNYLNPMFKIVDGKIRQIEAVTFNLPAPATSGFSPQLAGLNNGSEK